MIHYPRIPENLNLQKYKDAIGAGFFYLATGENPQQLDRSKIKKVKFALNTGEEKLLQDLLKAGQFKSQNEAFIFSLQWLHERSQTAPRILNVRIE